MINHIRLLRGQHFREKINPLEQKPIESKFLGSVGMTEMYRLRVVISRYLISGEQIIPAIGLWKQYLCCSNKVLRAATLRKLSMQIYLIL